MSLEQLQNQMVQLKSQAYDCLANIDFLRAQLNQINQQIAKVDQEMLALQKSAAPRVAETQTETPKQEVLTENEAS